MTDVHVFARIQPKAEFRDEVQSILAGILTRTRAEPGCKRFELNAGVEGDGNLYLVEIWTDQTALAQHHQMPYTVEAAARLDGKLAAETEVLRMSAVG